jgi:hypothetical protein
MVGWQLTAILPGNAWIKKYPEKTEDRIRRIWPGAVSHRAGIGIRKG